MSIRGIINRGAESRRYRKLERDRARAFARPMSPGERSDLAAAFNRAAQ